MTALFPDRLDPPDAADVPASLGAAAGRWRSLETWMAETYGLAPEPVWFGSDGWALRYRRSGRTLVSLVPREGGFVAMVVIGPAVAPGVTELDLGGATRQAFENAKAYPDGRWLFLSVDDDATLTDVERLVALKSPPPRRPRSAPSR